MAISTVDALVAALPGQLFEVYKTGVTLQVAGASHSLWVAAGIPGTAVAPSSGVAGDVPTSSTAGALPFTNPTAPALTYLGTLVAASSVAGILYVYDRLWQNSGLSVTSGVLQTVNSTALTRPDSTGAAAELWLQVYTTLGSGTPVITASYTNSAGTSGQTATITPTPATGSAATRTYPFALAGGDTGVRSVQSFTANATATSGAWGLVLRRRLAAIPVSATNVGILLDAITGGMPQVNDGACLEFVFLGSGSGAFTVQAPLALVQG